MGRLCTLGLILLLAACGSDNDRGPPRRSSQPPPLQVEVAFPSLTFTNPLLITHAGDGSDRLFVVEQAGRILVFPNDSSASSGDVKVFLDIRTEVLSGGEMGMLGLAFDPNFTTNGFFYVNYMRDSPRRTLISRFQVSATDPDQADAGSEQILLQFEQPFTNHNGGMLVFGPQDGMLYIATGDGGDANDPQNNAQNLSTLLGKILRINPVPGALVPADNPFATGTVGARGEIWALGLRNPWRMSFDRATGRLWAGDVGQNALEEIDIIVEGGNYGWRVFEGTRENISDGSLEHNFIFPIFEYDRSQGQSITGGFVYRGSDLPGFVGRYIYADFVSGRVWALEFDGNNDTALSNTEIANIPFPSSFGEDEAGELYITSFDGRIYRFRQR